MRIKASALEALVAHDISAAFLLELVHDFSAATDEDKGAAGATATVAAYDATAADEDVDAAVGEVSQEKRICPNMQSMAMRMSW